MLENTITTEKYSEVTGNIDIYAIIQMAAQEKTKFWAAAWKQPIRPLEAIHKNNDSHMERQPKCGKT